MHLEDLCLIEQGIMGFRELVTIRRDEPAYNPCHEKVMPSASEFIKVKGRGKSWSCLFFEDNGNSCSVYQNRPLECRLLFCRDTGQLTKIIGEDLLSRRALLAKDDPVLDLIERHEQECSYGLVNNLLTEENQVRDDIEARLTVLVGRDLAVRDGFLRSFPGRRDEELFLFGRPLFLVLAPYGFRL